MPTMISGTRATGGTNAVTSNQLVIDMEDTIHLLPVDTTPLATLLSSNGIGEVLKNKAKPGVYNGISLQRGTAYNPKHEWLEDQLNPRTDAVNFVTQYTTVATTIVVDNGSYFVAGQIVMVADSKEVMRVTGVSTNTLTVTRNLNADASGFNIDDNDELVILGDAESEGSSAPTANTTKTVAKYNLTQIYRRTVDVTGTQNATRQYGGNDLINQQRKAGADLMRDLEWSLFFGQRKEDTSGTTALRTMGGFQYYISTNVTDVNAALTEATFLAWLRGIFTNATKLFVFCSPIVMDAIAGFARGKLMTTMGESTYGVALTKYITPHGEAMLVREPVFSGATGGIGGYAVGVSMENVQLLHLEGRGPKLYTNIQAPDVDGRKDDFRSESTAAIRLEQTHGILKRVTG